MYIQGIYRLYTLVANKCPVTYEQWGVYSSVSLGIRTKRTSHFRNESPEDRVPSKIFWKYANYQLVSFLWHCAGFYDRYCLAVHLVSRFCPRLLSCLFVPVFRVVLLLFRVSARNTMRRRSHSFFSSLKKRFNPLT